MTRMILGIGAALAAAIALAGCGGSAGTGSGTVGATVSGGGMTTGGVAGAQTTKTTTTGGSLVQRAQQLQAQIRQAATAIRNGNAAGVMNAGGSIVRNCQDSLTTDVAPHATTMNQKQAVSRLRTACTDVAQAASKLTSGDTSAAKSLAQHAAQQAQHAVSVLRGS